MLRSQAPLYVRVMDLSRDLLPRCEKLPRSARLWLLPRVQNTLFELTDAITLALMFKDGRGDQLEAARRALVKLQITLDLMEMQKLLSARQARHVMGQVEVIGRMLAGWQRFEGQKQRSPPPAVPEPAPGVE